MAVSLQTLNYCASALHFVQAIVVAALIPGLNTKHKDDPPLMNGLYTLKKNTRLVLIPDSTPKCDNMPVFKGLQDTHYGEMYTFNDEKGGIALMGHFDAGSVDLRFLIMSFFMLSWLFQAAEGFVGDTPGPRLLRFVEYAFSASVMILAIAVEVGISDIYTLCCMFALIFATNLLGLMAELLCYLAENSTGVVAPWLWALPHCLGWVTCLVAYAPLLDHYLTSVRCSDMGPPGFVDVIVFLEFTFFICFGFVQIYSLLSRTLLLLSNEGGALSSARDYQELMQAADLRYTKEGKILQLTNAQSVIRNADLAYITLSFTAKTFLAWLILAPSL